ncbi:ArsR/SmtB family transcription factor [Humidisolicoccus flavus]|uniref:ArsR/SmtB family transcription factor n=1 Tax=Humidisolicoccus flavus TaxID=3111414 RepID=UPI00324A328C
MTDSGAVVPNGHPASASPARVDLESLKALAHPLRVRILHTLTALGPQTASGLAALLQESSGATSYHLRQLESKGFVSEAVSLGTGRERWWERTAGELEVWSEELDQLPGGRESSAVVLEAWSQSTASLAAAFVAGSDSAFGEPWTDAAKIASYNGELTVDELQRLTRDVDALIRSRLHNTTPREGSKTIHVQFTAFPPIGQQRLDTREVEQ